MRWPWGERELKNGGGWGWGVEVVSGGGNQRGVGICEIKVDSGYEGAGISSGRGERIEPRIRHRARRSVCVCGDEDASPRGRDPEGPSVAWSPLDCSDKPSGAGCATIGGHSQIGIP